MALASLLELERVHRRHDDVIAQLLDAARRLAAGRPHDTDLDAVEAAIDYFSRAVTRHFLDEEGSIFPRLSTRRPELAEALAALSAEHPMQVALQNAITEAARGLTDDARPGSGKALLELAERLAQQHQSHVAREDALFAAAHESLTAQDDVEIAAEMETRRDRDADNARPALDAAPAAGTRTPAPTKARPTKAQPAKAQPAKARPAKARPAKARPAKRTTTKAAPTTRTANKRAPAKPARTRSAQPKSRTQPAAKIRTTKNRTAANPAAKKSRR